MTTTGMSRAEKVDAATPESRNRVVDFLRAAAITVVVLGHWTIIAVDADGGILPHGVLDGAAWTHPLTWVFQVMPIFFLVGGYSTPSPGAPPAAGRGLRAVAAHPPETSRHPAHPAAARLAGDRRCRCRRRRAERDGAAGLADGADPHVVPRRLFDGDPGGPAVPCAVGAVRVVVDHRRDRARRGRGRPQHRR